MKNSILGIDPGLNGALSFIDPVAHRLIVVDMPTITVTRTKDKTEVIPQVIASYVEEFSPRHAYLEEVWSSPQMGVRSAFSFGDGYGCVKGVLAAHGVPLSKVLPGKWKAQMRTPKDKNSARQRAIDLLPAGAKTFMRVKDDGRAESALIALYGCFDLGIKFTRPLEVELAA